MDDKRSKKLPKVNIDDLLGTERTPKIRVRPFKKKPYDEASTWNETKAVVHARKKAEARKRRAERTPLERAVPHQTGEDDEDGAVLGVMAAGVAAVGAALLFTM